MMELPIMYKEAHWKVRKAAREEYICQQGGVCWYCGANLNEKPPEHILEKDINRELFPPNFFQWPIHLHHDHVTGMTIGAVHGYCNAVLWQYEGE